MPNRCVAVSCQSGYTEKKSEIADASEGSSSQELNLKENVPSFHFPSEETHSELRKEWLSLLIDLLKIGCHLSLLSSV